MKIGFLIPDNFQNPVDPAGNEWSKIWFHNFENFRNTAFRRWHFLAISSILRKLSCAAQEPVESMGSGWGSKLYPNYRFTWIWRVQEPHVLRMERQPRIEELRSCERGVIFNFWPGILRISRAVGPLRHPHDQDRSIARIHIRTRRFWQFRAWERADQL
jgi:hypothetical protein